MKNQGRSWTFPELSGGLEFGQVEADQLQGAAGVLMGRSNHTVSSLRD